MQTKLSYQEVVKNLFSRRSKTERELIVIEKTLERYGSPHLVYPTIHVAGTNGKGQVSAKIASALRDAGYKVGLYISPHIVDYAERITVNGKKISHEKVVDYDLDLQELSQREGWELNFFDCTTVYGFRHFQEESVDIAVIEVGLGGRYDSTNVVNPLVSIITSIGLDHTEFLGNTLEEIAAQKSGIIKENTPVVLGPTANLAPILEEANRKNAPIHTIEQSFTLYDDENRAVAKEAISLLPYSLAPESISRGLLENLPCRFERKGNTLFDVAHNEEGFRRLKEALKVCYPNQKFRFVIGMCERKDHEKSFKQIAEIARHIHFVQAEEQGSSTTKKLAISLQNVSDVPFTCEGSISLGVTHARLLLKENELLVVTGSFYVMSDALRS